MTQRAYDAVDKARNEFLRKQRKCAWCGAEFKTGDGLVAHITLKHPSGKEGRDLIEWAKGYKENPCHTKMNPPYGYGAHDYDDNPPKFDELSRALNTINVHYNVTGKHVSVAVDGPGSCYVQITDEVGDILKAYGPFSRDNSIMFITGMLEVVKTIRYE